MKVRVTLLAVFTAVVSLSGSLHAQDQFRLANKRVRCYTAEYIKQQQSLDPKMETDEQFEAWLAPLIQKQRNTANKVPIKNYKLPIIFHVIYSGEAEGTGTNVAQNLINANILQLNKDYANLSNSPYASATNTGLQFALATTSPTGTVLAEPGIDRVDATSKTWTAQPWATTYINSTIKPATYWDPTKYINIWIAPMSGGILGLATFPASSTLLGLNNNETNTTAGVIIDPSTVGSVFSPSGGCGSNTYNLGKTLTHELGHFFGLRHIWGDNSPACGNDYVADTPPSSNPHYGTFSHPDPDSACKTPDQMFENYMDYSDDHQLNTFTALQVDRIQTVMLNSPRRKTLPTSTVPTVDVTGTDSLAFAECSGAITLLETGTAGTITRYQDVDLALAVDGAASDAAIVTITTSGTAVQGVDYDVLTPVLNFAKNETSQLVKLRIYDNAKVESDKNILVSYTISGNGLQPAAAAQAILISIMDDDSYYVGQKTVNILNESFETVGATLPTNWAALATTNYPNSFVVGTKGTAGGTGQCAYLTSNKTTKPNTYVKGTSGAAVLATPTLSGLTVKSLGSLSFKYKVRGLAGADEAYVVYRIAYDSTHSLPFFGSTSGATGYGPFSGTGTTATGTPTLIPLNEMNKQKFRIYFYWRTGTATTGVNPGLNLDDVVFTGTPFPVETGITSSYAYPVGPLSYNNVKSKNGKALSIFLDSTETLPKLTVATIDSGFGSKVITIGGKQYNRSPKVFTIKDSVQNNTVLHRSGFFYSSDEIANWSAQKSSLQILQVADGADFYGNLDASNTAFIPATVFADSTNSRGYILFGANFKGLGTFALIDTAAIPLPVKLSAFKATVVGSAIKLTWKTESELNNKGFDVEKSLDGIRFEKIGFVKSLGTDNLSKGYSFNDESVATGKRYFYRLKQIDNDGTYAYSQVQSVTISESKKGYSVLVNPITDKLTIVDADGAYKKTLIVVNDAAGRTVFHKNVAITGQYVIGTGAWEKGVYLVRIGSDADAVTLKVIKN